MPSQNFKREPTCFPDEMERKEKGVPETREIYSIACTAILLETGVYIKKNRTKDDLKIFTLKINKKSRQYLEEN